MQMSGGHLLDADSTASTPYKISAGNLGTEFLSVSSGIPQSLGTTVLFSKSYKNIRTKKESSEPDLTARRVRIFCFWKKGHFDRKRGALKLMAPPWFA